MVIKALLKNYLFAKCKIFRSSIFLMCLIINFFSSTIDIKEKMCYST